MRLIDADELMEHVYRDKLDSRELIANMIKNAPTIEKRKRGEWIELDFTEAWEYKCDQCGRMSDFEDNFCPSCGADMR